MSSETSLPHLFDGVELALGEPRTFQMRSGAEELVVRVAFGEIYRE